jgi:hypothetical protein
MELTATTVMVALAGVFLICFMKGAFGGGFAIVGIPLLSIVMDPVKTPILLFKDNDYGTNNDFGQRNCVSVLDQAWLLSAYPEAKTEDKFGLKGNKKCSPLL